MKKNFLLSIGLISCSFVAMAQTDENTLGNQQVNVVKPYQPNISDAVKLNDNPKIEDSIEVVPDLKYEVIPRGFNSTFEVAPITPAKMKGEPLTKLYSGYAKAGYGNYATPYLEAFYNNLRSKEYSYGAYFRHLSSSGRIKDRGYSGYSDNNLGLYGKYFLKDHTLSAELDYSRNKVHYYGFTDTLNLSKKEVKDITAEQHFSKIGAELKLVSNYTDSSKINHAVQLGFYNLKDNYDATETGFHLHADVSKFYNQELYSVPLTIEFHKDQNLLDTFNTTIVTLLPNAKWQGKKWAINAGLNISVLSHDGEVTVHFYPDAEFSFNVADNLVIPYVGITGGIISNTMLSLTRTNPFFVAGNNIQPGNKKYEFYTGLRGTITKKISYNVRGYSSLVYGMPLFVNPSATEQLMFTAVYDTVDIMGLSAEISNQLNKELMVGIRGNFYNYKPENELSAWHQPAYDVTLSAAYNLRDKIIVSLFGAFYGKQDVKIYEADTAGNYTVGIKELKAAFDLSLNAEYRYTKRLSYFIALNNLTATAYSRWNNYPLQRFNMLLGLTYSF